MRSFILGLLPWSSASLRPLQPNFSPQGFVRTAMRRRSGTQTSCTMPSCSTDAEPPWYAHGLRFSCTQCSKCCTGKEAGLVAFSAAEGERMARRLGLTTASFYKRHARRARTRGLIDAWRVWALNEVDTPRGKTCVLLNTHGQCIVYEDRPLQCKTFPFWREHLASADNWAALAEECPGVGRGNLLIPLEEIKRSAEEQDAYWDHLAEEAPVGPFLGNLTRS